MPPFRRPAQSTLSGLGVAGAVLAAVVVTFATASGIVAYSLTSEDPIAPQARELVLDTGRSAQLVSAPLVLHASARAAGRRHAAVSARVPSVAVPVARAGRGSAQGTSRGGSAHGPGSAQPDGARNNGSSEPSSPGAPARVLEPVNDALGATTDAVDATTTSLTRRLRAAAERLRTGTAHVVGDTGDVLKNVSGGSDRVLTRLLDPPAR